MYGAGGEGKSFTMPRREAEMIYLYNSLMPLEDGVDDIEAFIDTNLSIKRVYQTLGYVQCLTPKAKMYMRRRRRYLLGEEALRLQGIWIKDAPSLRKFSDRQLHDLAGNAFCGLSFANALLVTLYLMSGATEGA